MKTFKITRYRGIDDLVSKSPYQTDDWSSTYKPFFEDFTEEEYKSNPKRYHDLVEEHNRLYIKSLTLKGEYGNPYEIFFHMTDYSPFEQDISDNPFTSGLFIPLGNVENKDIPKFNVKYDEDKT